MSITIRDARLGDAQAIAEIGDRSWREAYAGLIPQGLIESLDVESRRARLERQLAAPGPQHLTLVLEVDHAVAAFAGCGAPRDDDLGPQTGEIYAVYVAPEHTGAGYGRALVEAAEQRLRDMGYRQVFLWTLDNNEPACRFYERLGFRDDRRDEPHDIHGYPVRGRRYVRSIR